MSNVTRFPINGWKRAANRRGKHTASCIVTDRYLHFRKGQHKGEEGTAIIVDVMTDVSDNPRKITSLILTVEQLRDALKLYE
jgi:NifU-like protein involved in Fe-S cluster formation